MPSYSYLLQSLALARPLTLISYASLALARPLTLISYIGFINNAHLENPEYYYVLVLLATRLSMYNYYLLYYELHTTYVIYLIREVAK